MQSSPYSTRSKRPQPANEHSMATENIIDPPIRSEGTGSQGVEKSQISNSSESTIESRTGPRPSVVPSHVEQAHGTSFREHLRSSIVVLEVGAPGGLDRNSTTTFKVHQGLLKDSPFFSELISKDSRQESFVKNEEKKDIHIQLYDDDAGAVESVLEYLYTAEYYPRMIKTEGEDEIEQDPEFPDADDTGESILRHARVYTAAKRFGMQALQELAQRKILLVPSSTNDEIKYTRYIYENTLKEETDIRYPIIALWGSNSHGIRHEAREEFKNMCLEYPEFGFDVLNLTLQKLDKVKEKKSSKPDDSKRPKKRVRTS